MSFVKPIHPVEFPLCETHFGRFHSAGFFTLLTRVDFSEVTGGPRRARPSRRALSFRDISMGETAGLQLDRAGAMRRGQDSPVDMLLKRQAREPWN